MAKRKKKQFRRRELKLEKVYDQCAEDLMQRKNMKFNQLIENLILEECKRIYNP